MYKVVVDCRVGAVLGNINVWYFPSQRGWEKKKSKIGIQRDAVEIRRAKPRQGQMDFLARKSTSILQRQRQRLYCPPAATSPLEVPMTVRGHSRAVETGWLECPAAPPQWSSASIIFRATHAEKKKRKKEKLVVHAHLVQSKLAATTTRQHLNPVCFFVFAFAAAMTLESAHLFPSRRRAPPPQG